MLETIDSTMQNGKAVFENAIEHFKNELTKIRAGKASPSMLDGIMVDYYSNPTPLSQVANISSPDSKTLSIQPWEKNMLGPIEQAIFAANLGLTPMNDGEFVRITIPPLTEERRVQLAKQSKSLAEEGKISLRNTRHKIIDFIKKEVKDGYPEDAGRNRTQEVDDMVKDFIAKIEKLLAAKEKDIMTV